MPGERTAVLRIRTLGAPAARLGDEAPPRELTWRKHLALAVYLARSGPRGRTREHLAGLFWPEKPEATARHSLNEALRQLRRNVGEDAVVAEGDTVRLAAGRVRLDVDRLDELAESGQPEAAAELVTGEFMEGFGVPGCSAFEDWLAAERRHWRRRGVELLCAHGERRLDGGDVDGSLEAAYRAVRLDPYSAEAVRTMMRGLAVRGERSEALRAFEAFAERLEERLRLEPDPETRLLADRIRRERSWKVPARASAPDAAEPDPRRPPLVGRDRPLGELLELWRSCREEDRAGLALLRGEAGSGKTRLAEELAARARLDGAVVASIRAVEADREQPLAGLLALARGPLLDAPGVLAAAPSALAGLASRVTAWSDLFGQEIGDAAPLPPPAALSEVITSVAVEQPVLLVADDAHWLDRESLLALGALLRDLEDRPLLLLLVSSSARPRAELDELGARLGRELPGTSLQLEPLPRGEIRRLVGWALPGYDEEAGERLARRLEIDSAGLPFLVVELLGAVTLGMELEEAEPPAPWPEPARTLEQSLPGELPEPVVAAIRIGFRKLGENAQRVLTAAAVAGPRVQEARVARVAELEGDPLHAALDELEWGGWLVAEPRGYAFRARIVREVVERDMLTPGQRRRLEERAAGPA